MRPDLLIQLGVAHSRQSYLRGHQALWIEAGIGRAQIKEALDQQSRAREQEE